MAVEKGSYSTSKTGRTATPKQVNAVTRAMRSKKTNPAAAARSRAVVGSSAAAPALAQAQARIAKSEQKIKKVARRAVRKGLNPGSPGPGLSLTKNEGSRGLQRAVKTVGYKQAREIASKVAKRRSS